MSAANDGVTAFVGIGSNLGDRLGALRLALSGMMETPGVELLSTSPVYETEAHVLEAQEAQPDHLNAVVQLCTTLSPRSLLQRLLELERTSGRLPSAQAWAPRHLDLDLLIFGDVVVEAHDLTLPHPRMAERRFVLQPLADLVHNLVVPGADGASVSDLLERCPDTKRVRRTDLRLETDAGPSI